MVGGHTNTAVLNSLKTVNTQRSSQDVLELLEKYPNSMDPMKSNENSVPVKANTVKPAEDVKYVS